MHRVQHTPSTAYTEYSIHHGQALTNFIMHPILSVFPSLLRQDLWKLHQLLAYLPTRFTTTSHDFDESSKIMSPHHICTVESELPDEYSLITTQHTSNGPPPSAPPISLDNGFQVHPETPSWPPSASRSSLNLGLEVHFQTRLITSSQCISVFTWSSCSDTPGIALKHRLQPVQIYRV